MATTNKYLLESIELIKSMTQSYINGIEPISKAPLDMSEESIEKEIFKYREALLWALSGLEELAQRPDEKGIRFTSMGGFGIVRCVECDYAEKIVSFMHGINGCTTGYQCQSCWQLQSVDDIQASDIKNGCACGGTLSRQKKLICPRCHSVNLKYKSGGMA